MFENAKGKTKANALDKRFFPSYLKNPHHLMDRSLEQDIKSGFNNTGIFPLNRNRFLDLLPLEIVDEKYNEKNYLTCV